MDNKEYYYTYFIPFYNKKNKYIYENKYFNFKNNLINKNTLLKYNIKIGYYNYKLINNLKKILIYSIKYKNFTNITLYKFDLYDSIYNSLINKNIDLGCISNLYIYNNLIKINNSIEFVCNISTPTIYACYSKQYSNKNIKSIFEPDVKFRTSIINKNILKLITSEEHIYYENNINNLINYLLNGGSNIIIFRDENPSNILYSILNKDYNNNIQLIPINYDNITSKIGNNIFNKTFIKLKSNNIFNIDILKYNFKIETISIYESLYIKTNNNNINYIYNLLSYIYKNIDMLINININNISNNTSFIPINSEAIKFYTNCGLISDNNSNYSQKKFGID